MGDEYEGQILLRRLVQILAETKVCGRIIILPALNRPAVLAGRRTSPMDGGKPQPAVSRQRRCRTDGDDCPLRHRGAFPLADYAIDLHSGGSSLDYLPVAFAHRGRTAEQSARLDRLLASFSAPHTLLTDGRGGGGDTTLYACAAAHGVAAMTTELGGGSGLFLRRPWQSERRGCAACCAISASRPISMLPRRKKRGICACCRRRTTIFARSDGLFEPKVRVGQEVCAGADSRVSTRI